MRKVSLDRTRLSPASQGGSSDATEPWLDLEQIAQVEVSSEDPECPIESAFTAGASSGWRAAKGGEQTIRLIFDTRQQIHRIRLRFVETEVERTQEFSLRWRTDRRGPAAEIVRQQWNFSPGGATTEVEDYKVDLDQAGILELTINPDVSHGETVATLAEWRVA
jgi:hypothetical protein